MSKMTRQKNATGGFTIIEIILFLAVSSSMILIAVASIGNRTESVRFTDSVRGIESFIERRISLTESGSITGDQQNCKYDSTRQRYNLVDPSDGTCVFLGYMFEFGDYENRESAEPARNQIFVYQMFGRRMTSQDIVECPSQEEILSCARPVRAPQEPVEIFDIPWGAEVTYTLYSEIGGIPNSNPKIVGYLKNPANQGILPISISKRAHAASSYPEILDDPSIYEISNPLSFIDDEFSAGLCVYDGERISEIRFGRHERQESIDVLFANATDENIICDNSRAYIQ